MTIRLSVLKGRTISSVECGLTRDTTQLCSVAGDLKIAVPVLGEGHASNVTFHMPLSVFR